MILELVSLFSLPVRAFAMMTTTGQQQQNNNNNNNKKSVAVKKKSSGFTPVSFREAKKQGFQDENSGKTEKKPTTLVSHWFNFFVIRANDKDEHNRRFAVIICGQDNGIYGQNIVTDSDKKNNQQKVRQMIMAAEDKNDAFCAYLKQMIRSGGKMKDINTGNYYDWIDNDKISIMGIYSRRTSPSDNRVLRQGKPGYNNQYYPRIALVVYKKDKCGWTEASAKGYMCALIKVCHYCASLL